MLTKTICLITKPDGAQIQALVAGGLSVAAIPAILPKEEIQVLRDLVLEAFATLNSPVGLMLYAPQKDTLPLAAELGFDFVLLREPLGPIREVLPPYTRVGYEVGPGGSVPAGSDWDFVYFAAGAPCQSAAEDLLRSGKTIALPQGDASPLRDALFFPDEAAFLAALPQGGFAPPMPPRREAPLRDLQNYLRQDFSPSGESALAFSTILCAQSSGAQAILAMTADGENIPPLASFLAGIPIIAVANRALYEKLLLSLSGCYGVLPTAITRIPDTDDQVLAFAREVARLYGYQEGETIVVTGHYNIDCCERSVHIITI